MGARDTQDTQPKIIVIDGAAVTVSTPKSAMRLFEKAHRRIPTGQNGCQLKLCKQLVGYLYAKAEQVDKLKNEVKQLRPAGEDLAQLVDQHSALKQGYKTLDGRYLSVLRDYLDVIRDYTAIQNAHETLQAKHTNLQDRYLVACQEIDLVVLAPPGRDNLTELYTQEYFYDALEREVSRAHRYQCDLTLAMFKLGGLEGFDADQSEDIICLFADSLQEKLRKSNIAVRYDVDEFALVLPMTGSEESKIPVKKILSRFSSKLREEGITGPQVYSSGALLQSDDDHDSFIARALLNTAVEYIVTG